MQFSFPFQIRLVHTQPSRQHKPNRIWKTEYCGALVHVLPLILISLWFGILGRSLILSCME